MENIWDEDAYITIGHISQITNLPRNYLYELADSKKIPALRTKKGLRFNPKEVRKALAKLAMEGGDLNEQIGLDKSK